MRQCVGKRCVTIGLVDDGIGKADATSCFGYGEVFRCLTAQIVACGSNDSLHRIVTGILGYIAAECGSPLFGISVNDTALSAIPGHAWFVGCRAISPAGDVHRGIDSHTGMEGGLHVGTVPVGNSELVGSLTCSIHTDGSHCQLVGIAGGATLRSLCNGLCLVHDDVARLDIVVIGGCHRQCNGLLTTFCYCTYGDDTIGQGINRHAVGPGTDADDDKHRSKRYSIDGLLNHNSWYIRLFNDNFPTIADIESLLCGMTL